MHTSQNQNVLAELQAFHGTWVEMTRLVEVSGSYNIHSRIDQLRDLGYEI